jgi:hypothetical protein
MRVWLIASRAASADVHPFVPIHTTCFGLTGHLQVYKLVSQGKLLLLLLQIISYVSTVLQPCLTSNMLIRMLLMVIMAWLQHRTNSYNLWHHKLLCKLHADTEDDTRSQFYAMHLDAAI